MPGYPAYEIAELLMQGLRSGQVLNYILTEKDKDFSGLISKIIINITNLEKSAIISERLQTLSFDRLSVIQEILEKVSMVHDSCKNKICHRASQIKRWINWLGESMDTKSIEDLYRRISIAFPRQLLISWFNHNNLKYEKDTTAIAERPFSELHSHLTSSVTVDHMWQEMLRTPLTYRSLYPDSEISKAIRVGRVMRALLFAFNSLQWVEENNSKERAEYLETTRTEFCNHLKDNQLWWIIQDAAFPVLEIRYLLDCSSSLKIYSILMHHLNKLPTLLRPSYDSPYKPLPNRIPWIDSVLYRSEPDDKVSFCPHSKESGLCLSTVKVLYAICRATFGASIGFTKNIQTGLDFFGTRYKYYTQFKKLPHLRRRLLGRIFQGYAEEKTENLELRLCLDSASKGATKLRELNQAFKQYKEGKVKYPIKCFRVIAHALKRPNGSSIEENSIKEAKTAIFLAKFSKSYKDILYGFDAAGNERDGAVQMFINAFNIAKEGFAKDSNGLTYHAGEDYRNPICGLREIWNAVNILKVKRIGHGTVLGYTPYEFLKENNLERCGWLLSPLDVVLNLLWILQLMCFEEKIKNNPEIDKLPFDPWSDKEDTFTYKCPVCVYKVDHEIARKRIIHILLNFIKPECRKEIHWIRYDRFIKSDKEYSIVQFKLITGIKNHNNSIYQCKVSRVPYLWVPYYAWLGTLPYTDEDEFSFHHPQEKDFKEDIFKELIASYRNPVLYILKKRRILIEVCPTSNNLIMHLDYKKSPCHFLKRLDIPFTLCTDNRGILNTSIRNEYEHIVRTSKLSNPVFWNRMVNESNRHFNNY
jgi:adenosine deaminase